MSSQNQILKLQGSLSILLCASVWGLFWIPLQYFDASGVKALWAVAGITFSAALIAIAFAIRFGMARQGDFKLLLITGLGMGAANVLYFAGILLSDVLRVIFLFYLLPLWATLFAKMFFNVPIGRKRIFAIALAVLGVWLLLGAGGWPLPKNLGDVFGILAGMLWALGLTMMRGRQEIDIFMAGASTFAIAFVLAVLLGTILHITRPDIQPTLPTVDQLGSVVLPMLAFGAFVLWTSIIGQLWGAKHVAATTAALLTMSEIVVATISIAMLQASSMEILSMVGACLILLAVLIDLFANSRSQETVAT